MRAHAPVGRTALRLTPLIVLGRGVGFLFPVLVAHLYGVSGITDAFFFAAAVPVVVVVILTNTVGAVITPILARLPPEGHADFVGRVGSVAALVALGVTAAIGLFVDPVLARFSAFEPSTRALCASYVIALAPFAALSALAVVTRAAADIHGLFAWAAAAPIPRSVGILGGLWLMAGRADPWALPLAMNVGGLAEVAWLTGGLLSTGVCPRPAFGLDPAVRGALRDALPLLVGQGAAAAQLLVDRAFAGSLDPGSVSVLDYADRVRLIPQTLLEGTLLPVAFATWAHQLAKRASLDYAKQLDQSLRWVALLAAPPLMVLYVGRYVAVDLLFHRGEFSADDAVAAARAFGWYVPGLLPMLMGGLAMRAHVVEGRLRLILALGLIALGSKVVLDASLIGTFGVEGLVMASSLTWCLVHGTYLFALRRRISEANRGREWAATLVLVGGSALVALLVELIPGPPRSWSDPVLWGALGCSLALLSAGALLSRKQA